jgi:hypothetical protein
MVVRRIAFAPCDERLQLSLDPFLRNRRLNLSDARFQTLPIGFPCGATLLRGREEKKQLLLKSKYGPARDGANVGAARNIPFTTSRPGSSQNEPSEQMRGLPPPGGASIDARDLWRNLAVSGSAGKDRQRP